MIYSVEIHNKTKFSLHFKDELSKIFVLKEDSTHQKEEIPIESSEESGCGNENIINATLKDTESENNDSGCNEFDEEGYYFNENLTNIFNLIIFNVKGVEGIFVTKHRIKIANGIFFEQNEIIETIMTLIDPAEKFKKVDMP